MYEKLINMTRPVSQRHAPMTLYNRAAQFAPFAALTGLDEELGEAGRLTDADTELTEERIAELDRLLRQAVEENRTVSLTCFIPDSKKAGGAYRTFTAKIKKADPTQGLLILQNGITIPFWSIKAIR